MTAISRFLRTTILGGAFFLMPIVVLAYLMNKAFDFARRGLKPVERLFQINWSLERQWRRSWRSG